MSTPQFLRGSDQFYTSAQAKQQEKRGMTGAERLIDRANNVSIFDVLEDFFGLELPRDGASFKSRCPFSFEHADGGLDKGWRTYPGTNSSMCFPMHGFMTPVRLIQIKYQERTVKSAERILKNYDLLRPKPWRERYAELALELERQQEMVGNPQHAVEALSMALRTNGLYTRRQFDSDVMEAMEAVLEKLNEVTATNDPERVREWYEKTKKIMLKVVEGTTPK